ncbi:MAG: urea carboxylase-associated family protein [Opitutus sp.]|nr:urea carboxylase-associated family protein [Opitutus sp.]MCS6247361.1 urea carboxylase-associated family protein [Opitutus sp.]MCS6274693.1 urea carboxylase-associated family protein [Opitutus sp.]MCS6276612.1 urea carboxylase-associated family protein [Opitutus sp.]MCS6301739.1 urea carboxylase-associated family protein [Opitutus sp.]
MSVLIYTESPHAPAAAIYRRTIPAGDFWMHEIKAGQTLRILDLEGNQAADTLFYNATDFRERYSAQDTIRENGGIYLTTGTRLYSNELNVLVEITADTCGRHDTLGGACACESNTVRYGHGTRHMHSCRQSFLLGLMTWPGATSFELNKRDIPANINFFMNVPVTPTGGLQFEDGVSAPGKYVEMVARMDVVCLISNCPQLNNPCNAYNPTPVEVLIWP